MKRTVLIPKRSGYKKSSQISSGGNFIPRRQGTIYGKKFSPRPVRHRVEEYRPEVCLWVMADDYTVWSYSEHGNRWRQIGPALEHSNIYSNVCWNGSIMMCVAYDGANAYVCGFDGNKWQTFNQSPTYRGYWFHLVWTGTEFLARASVGTWHTLTRYGLFTVSEISGITHIVAFYDSGACGCYDYIDWIYPWLCPAWTGTKLFSLIKSTTPTGLDMCQLKVWFSTWNQNDGVVCGDKLPGYFIGAQGSFGAYRDELIWNGQDIWVSGVDVYTQEDFSKSPILATVGLAGHRIVHEGPGFVWYPLFWNGKHMWVYNTNDYVLWKFSEEIGWREIAEVPQKFKTPCLKFRTIYPGKLKPDGTPV